MQSAVRGVEPSVCLRREEGLLQGWMQGQDMEGQAAMCLLQRAGKGFQAKGSSTQAEEGWRWEVVNTHCSKHFTRMSSFDPHINPVR